MNSAFIQSTVLTSPMIGNCRKMISFVPDSDGYDGADDIQRTDGADFTVPCLYTPLYEWDAPNMSRAICLKRGEKVVKRFIFADPVHFISGVGK